jgi:hypothetical protein
MRRHGLLLLHQRLQPLLERQHQLQILYYQLAYLARQILVDNLNVAANVVSLIVPRHKYYYTILDKYVAVPSLDSVAVPDA